MIIKNLRNKYLYKDALAWKDIRRPSLLYCLLQFLAYQTTSDVSLNEQSSRQKNKIKTAESYIDVLEKSFVVFRLKSYNNNGRKKVSKMKKIFFLG